MKDIFLNTVNRRVEIFKGLLGVLLICSWKRIYDFGYMRFCSAYSVDNIEYIMRITATISLLLIISYGVSVFRTFLKKNSESLLLLGRTNYEIGVLFFLKHYEITFVSGYIYSMLAKYYEVSVVKGIFIGMLNTCIIGVLIIFCGFIINYKIVQKIVYMLIGVMGFLCICGKLNYNSIYGIMMSDQAEIFIKGFYMGNVAIKIPIFILFCLITYKMINIHGMIIESDRGMLNRSNLCGDFFHKKIFATRKNYFWIYRDADFVIWKVFSTVIYAVLCIQSKDIITMILSGYIICVVTSSYFLNIYLFERKQGILYYMSNYTFADLLRTNMGADIAIIGDNIFVILLLAGICNKLCIVVLPVMFVMVIFIVLFINVAFYGKYPRKLFLLDYIVIIIKMNIPILNLWIMFRNYTVGKENWSKYMYGK